MMGMAIRNPMASRCDGANLAWGKPAKFVTLQGEGMHMVACLRLRRLRGKRRCWRSG